MSENIPKYAIVATYRPYDTVALANTDSEAQEKQKEFIKKAESMGYKQLKYDKPLYVIVPNPALFKQQGETNA